MSGDLLDRFRLDGRTAIVAGMGPGIGEHVARAFAAAGANVVVAARRPDRIESVAAGIRDAGGQALAITADVASEPDLAQLVAGAREAFGPVTILFANASGGLLPPDADFWDNDDAVWKTALAVNVLAPYRLARLCRHDMQAAGNGSIIAVMSTAGLFPFPPQVAYGTTKAGMMMLIRQLAKHCAPWARANALGIGSTSADGAIPPRFAGLGLEQKNALKRYGTADEAAVAALFLASDASSYTTGTVLQVEGGRVGTLA